MARPSRQRPAVALAQSNASSLNQFVKVTKVPFVADGLLAKKEMASKIGGVSTTSSRKRKSVDDEDTENIPIGITAVIEVQSAKRSRRQGTFVAVVEKAPQPPVQSATTASARKTREATSKAEKLHHKSTATSIIASAKRDSKTKSHKVKSIHAVLVEKHTARNGLASLPDEFLELIDLHKAFLKTITLQIAHAGANAPIDLHETLPHISRAWRKRAVTVEDVRRCIAIEDMARDGQPNASPSPFTITDYGRGKICLEVRPESAGTPIDEKKMGREFAKNLEALHAQRSSKNSSAQTSDDGMELDISLSSLSLADLPQAPITARSQYSINPLLAHGQRALAELKTGLALKQQQEQEAKLKKAAAASSPDLNPDGTKLSVLDRIRLKQLAKAQAPLPPTAAELERKAALQRVADVASIILMLTRATYPRQPRQPFPMPVLLQKIKDSLSVPISGEERTAAVRLIAEEVAPEWLRIVKIGGRETVVVTTGCEPSVGEITARAERIA